MSSFNVLLTIFSNVVLKKFRKIAHSGHCYHPLHLLRLIDGIPRAEFLDFYSTKRILHKIRWKLTISFINNPFIYKRWNPIIINMNTPHTTPYTRNNQYQNKVQLLCKKWHYWDLGLLSICSKNKQFLQKLAFKWTITHWKHFEIGIPEMLGLLKIFGS